MTTHTKRDRFEEMVEKELQKYLKGDQIDGWRVIPLRLLRRQHSAVVRAVKKLYGEEFANMSDDFQAGQHNAYARVLATLARMKGGR